LATSLISQENFITMTANPSSRWRIVALMAVLSASALLLIAQLFRWQVLEHQAFLAIAEQEHQSEVTIRPRRGVIYDRNEFLLATDAFQYAVSASPPMISDPQATADRLFPLLEMSREDTLIALTSDASWVPLSRGVPQPLGDRILEWDITGIEVATHPKRVYPGGTLAAHLLGFVNDNDNGFYGIEGYYDAMLSGAPGLHRGERDPFGSSIPIGPGQFIPARDGISLALTTDRTAQYIVERELADAIVRYQAESGTVVVVDPKTGGIVAMASWPAYDPNHFAKANQQHFPDPAVSEQYEPGSVFKIITLAAGLDSGAITPETTIYDGGAIEVGGRTIYNWDRNSYGTVDMTTVLGKSLNVGAAQVAVMLGKDRFYTYVRRFGFGRITEVDLDSEGPGTLKIPGDPDWHESDLGTNSFGQGIAVTPLQMAMAVAAVANDGLLMKPHAVQQIIEGDRVLSVQPTVVRRVILAQAAQTLTQIMVTAVNQETELAQVPGYRVAGKTGTAQIPIPGGYHPTFTVASFAGYLPADDPALVILVVIHKPQTSPWGGQVAAPVFARIAQQLVILFDIPPDDIRLGQSTSQQFSACPSSCPTGQPDYRAIVCTFVVT
jgi:cell division protein FtsI/penicillin-binding protein 2